MRKILFITLNILLIATVCWAAVTITGVDDSSPGHDQSVVITGTGFGTKTNVAPQSFTDFETAQDGLNTPGDGTQLTDNDVGDGDGQWANVSTEAVHPKFSNTNQRTNSGYNAKFYYYSSDPDNEIHSGLVWQGARAATGGKMFTSFWIKHSWGSLYGSEAAAQYKMTRFTGHDYYTTAGIVASNMWYRGTGVASSVREKNEAGWTNDVGTYLLTKYYQPNVFEQSEWCLYQIWAIGTSDATGEIHYRILRPNAASVGSDDTTGVTTLKTGQSLQDCRYSLMYTNLTAQSAPIEATTYIDDIYIDDSWARVEIGNNSSYDSCTHREMQIPTAWNATSITVDVNTGSLPNGTYYIFVVDNDGAESAGYEISIGPGNASFATSGKVDFSGNVTIQ